MTDNQHQTAEQSAADALAVLFAHQAAKQQQKAALFNDLAKLLQAS